jgi:hypothetical protein
MALSPKQSICHTNGPLQQPSKTCRQEFIAGITACADNTVLTIWFNQKV